MKRLGLRAPINYAQLERDWHEIEDAFNSLVDSTNLVITQVNTVTATQNFGGVVAQQQTGLASTSGAQAAVSHADHAHGTPPYASYAKLGF